MPGDRRIIYRLPYVNEPYCPVCHQRLTHYRSYTFQVPKANDGTELIDALLYNCQDCNLFFVDKEILQGIRDKHRGNPLVFMPGTSRETILNDAYSKPKKPVDSSLPIQRIICNADITEYCVQCHGKLDDMQVVIPTNKKKSETLCGRGCSSCNILYVDHLLKNTIRSWINKSPNRNSFFLDEKSIYDHQQTIRMKKASKGTDKLASDLQQIQRQDKINQIMSVHQKIFESYPSAIVILYADFGDGKLKRIVIVKNVQEENQSEGVYYFEREKSREYLSAAYAPQRNKSGVIDGKEYSITKIYPNTSDELKDSLDTMIPKAFIHIGKDGGNYSSTRNDLDNEIIWLLVYALGTNRYELLEATYNKRKDYCFTDIWHYRQFVKHYGKPDLDLEMDRAQKSSGSSFSDLNSQSFLNSYGYNVNQTEGLSESYRQELLAEVIDLELMSQSEISRFLNWCISTSAGRHPIAESKWECDRKFVDSYRFNPKRFLIANN